MKAWKLQRARVLSLCFASALLAQRNAVADDKDSIQRYLDDHMEHFAAVASRIWDYAELGYQEEKSAALLQEQLEAEGFHVDRGVAEIPTAFVASYGEGKPVIGLIAEFDALPGISQDVATERKVREGKEAGHACGHHLFGTGSTAAAIAVKDFLARTGRSGTIRLYGTPAEEGGAGKVYMVRAGLLDDADAVLTWHSDGVNNASPQRTLANKSAKFRFRGLSAHAARAPEQGRSALDGVEAMNYMANLLREHVPEKARIHYVITRGGSAPNVVPDFAEVFYYCRHPDTEVVEDLFSRLVDAAEGAARGTGTRMEYEVIHGSHSKNPNVYLHRLIDANLRRVGGYAYTPEEQRFAEALHKTLADQSLPIGSQQDVQPFEPGLRSSSTDVGDVSWVVPTGSMTAATWVPGTPSHSWQAVAAGGMSIGPKGMAIAAKTLAMTAVDLFTDPEHVGEARAELLEAQGPGFVYRALLGDRKPPLDYRK